MDDGQSVIASTHRYVYRASVESRRKSIVRRATKTEGETQVRFTMAWGDNLARFLASQTLSDDGSYLTEGTYKSILKRGKKKKQNDRSVSWSNTNTFDTYDDTRGEVSERDYNSYEEERDDGGLIGDFNLYYNGDTQLTYEDATIGGLTHGGASLGETTHDGSTLDERYDERYGTSLEETTLDERYETSHEESTRDRFGTSTYDDVTWDGSLESKTFTFDNDDVVVSIGSELGGRSSVSSSTTKSPEGSIKQKSPEGSIKQKRVEEKKLSTNPNAKPQPSKKQVKTTPTKPVPEMPPTPQKRPGTPIYLAACNSSGSENTDVMDRYGFGEKDGHTLPKPHPNESKCEEAHQPVVSPKPSATTPTSVTPSKNKTTVPAKKKKKKTKQSGQPTPFTVIQPSTKKAKEEAPKVKKSNFGLTGIFRSFASKGAKKSDSYSLGKREGEKSKSLDAVSSPRAEVSGSQQVPTALPTPAPLQRAGSQKSEALVSEVLESPDQVMQSRSVCISPSKDALENMSLNGLRDWIDRRAASDDESITSLTKKEHEYEGRFNSQKQADENAGHIGLILPFLDQVKWPSSFKDGQSMVNSFAPTAFQEEGGNATEEEVTFGAHAEDSVVKRTECVDSTQELAKSTLSTDDQSVSKMQEKPKTKKKKKASSFAGVLRGLATRRVKRSAASNVQADGLQNQVSTDSREDVSSGVSAKIAASSPRAEVSGSQSQHAATALPTPAPLQRAGSQKSEALVSEVLESPDQVMQSRSVCISPSKDVLENMSLNGLRDWIDRRAASDDESITSLTKKEHEYEGRFNSQKQADENAGHIGLILPFLDQVKWPSSFKDGQSMVNSFAPTAFQEEGGNATEEEVTFGAQDEDSVVKRTECVDSTQELAKSTLSTDDQSVSKIQEKPKTKKKKKASSFAGVLRGLATRRDKRSAASNVQADGLQNQVSADSREDVSSGVSAKIAASSPRAEVSGSQQVPTALPTPAPLQRAGSQKSEALVSEVLESPDQVMQSRSVCISPSKDDLENMSLNGLRDWIDRRAASDDESITSLTKKEHEYEGRFNSQKQADENAGHIGLILPFLDQVKWPSSFHKDQPIAEKRTGEPTARDSVSTQYVSNQHVEDEAKHVVKIEDLDVVASESGVEVVNDPGTSDMVQYSSEGSDDVGESDGVQGSPNRAAGVRGFFRGLEKRLLEPVQDRPTSFSEGLYDDLLSLGSCTTTSEILEDLRSVEDTARIIYKSLVMKDGDTPPDLISVFSKQEPKQKGTRRDVKTRVIEINSTSEDSTSVDSTSVESNQKNFGLLNKIKRFSKPWSIRDKKRKHVRYSI